MLSLPYQTTMFKYSFFFDSAGKGYSLKRLWQQRKSLLSIQLFQLTSPLLPNLITISLLINFLFILENDAISVSFPTRPDHSILLPPTSFSAQFFSFTTPEGVASLICSFWKTYFLLGPLFSCIIPSFVKLFNSFLSSRIVPVNFKSHAKKFNRL